MAAAMIVGICQPHYLPWMGQFDMIDQADLWVFLDTVQLERQSWQTRNRVLANGSPSFLSIPVAHGDTSILDAMIVEGKWRQKHQRTLAQIYGRCEHWHALKPVTMALDVPHGRLSYFTSSVTVSLARTLGISTPFMDASALEPTRTDTLGRIADLLHQTGATEFLEAAGGRAVFGHRVEGIPVRFHSYTPAPYRQDQRGSFVPYLSVVDCLARHGGERTLATIRQGRV